jgi:hypothetical protein
MSVEDDLDVLEPKGNTVTYLGERLEVKPLTIGQLPKFVRLARPVIDALLDADFEKLSEGADVDMLMGLIDQHGDKVFEAASLVTGKPRDWLEAGDIAEFVTLVMAIVAVNRDFFTQKLAPLLAGRAKQSSGDGQTASSSSSEAAIH